MNIAEKTVWLALRISLGWIYFWAFFDKTFGLGFATGSGMGWINGNSPTYGYLMYGTKGPFAEYYQALAEFPFIEWLFMLGILFVGVTLLSGVAVRAGALVGALFSVLFYTSGFMPPEHNPFLDEHIIYLLVFVGIIITAPSAPFDGSRWWRSLPSIRTRTHLY